MVFGRAILKIRGIYLVERVLLLFCWVFAVVLQLTLWYGVGHKICKRSHADRFFMSHVTIKIRSV
jgi:hypothetical protein